MRSVRTIAIGCIVAVCAMGALSAPAFAAKEKLIFGKFVASTSGATHGVGTVSKLTIGPYKFTGEQLFEEKEGTRVAKKNESGEDEFGPLCKSVVAKGTVEEGESENLAQTLTFNHCVTYRSAGNAANGLKEEVTTTFKLGIEFHSNHSATFGEPGAESATIEEGSVVFKGSKSQCTIEIPAQPVPLSSGTEKGMEKEFEAALYETEEESLEGKKIAGKDLRSVPRPPEHRNGIQPPRCSRGGELQVHEQERRRRTELPAGLDEHRRPGYHPQERQPVIRPAGGSLIKASTSRL